MFYHAPPAPENHLAAWLLQATVVNITKKIITEKNTVYYKESATGKN